MTFAVQDAGAAAHVAGPVTASENLITLLGGVWLTAGLFIDGYAHSNIIDTGTEDFFTPWHGIFYSGFTFCAGWIAYLMYRRRNVHGIKAWIPAGYGWAVVGLGVFAAGGIGDLIWHSVFGVENGIDALLSPTHLLLLFGLVVVLAAPLQSVIHSGGSIWVALTSTTILALLAGFFTTYIRPIGGSWVLSIPFDPARSSNNEVWAALMVGGVLFTTAVMVLPVMYVVRRFSLPFGAVTLLWFVPAVGEALALSDTPETAAVGALAGGLVADLLLRNMGQTRLGVGIAMSVGALVTWSAWTVAQVVFNDPIGMPPEVWTGQILLSAFVAAALVIVTIADDDALPPGSNPSR